MTAKLIAGMSTIALCAILAPGAHAACNTDLRRVDQNIDPKSRAGFGTAARDIRQLRDSANLLAGYGEDQACQEVMKAIRDIAQKPQYHDKKRTDWRPNVSDKDVHRAEIAKRATPVLDARGQFSAEKMVGATVYSSSTGKSVGEVEDIVLGGGNQHFAVISHGGFLGLGEKRVKVALSDIKVNRSDNTYYVPLSDQDVETAAGVEWRDGQWTGAAVKPGSASERGSATKKE